MEKYDKEYRQMLERYADEEKLLNGHRSSNRLRIVETWNIDSYVGRGGHSWRRGVWGRRDEGGRARKCVVL